MADVMYVECPMDTPLGFGQVLGNNTTRGGVIVVEARGNTS